MGHQKMISWSHLRADGQDLLHPQRVGFLPFPVKPFQRGQVGHLCGQGLRKRGVGPVKFRESYEQVAYSLFEPNGRILQFG